LLTIFSETLEALNRLSCLSGDACFQVRQSGEPAGQPATLSHMPTDHYTCKIKPLKLPVCFEY
jgi:hypothetical protein